MINDLKMVNEREMTIYCPTCKEEYKTELVTFLDTEEYMGVKDLMLFKCNVCNTTHKSFVFKN